MTLGEIDLSIGSMYLLIPFPVWKLTEAGMPLVPSVILVAPDRGRVRGDQRLHHRLGRDRRRSSRRWRCCSPRRACADHLALRADHDAGHRDRRRDDVRADLRRGHVLGAHLAARVGRVLQVVLCVNAVGASTRSRSAATGLRAAEAGINTRLVILRNFVLCAMCAGLAGILEGVRTSCITPDPSGSAQFLLYAIAAVIIGGTADDRRRGHGGRGDARGAVPRRARGRAVIKSVNANYEDLYLGIAIIIAMTIYVLVQRVRKGSGRG